MIITKKLLTRLEGEVKIKFVWSEGKIKDAYISVPTFRNFEKILVGKPVLDATVINPRICGICGHAHLRATVEAIENALKNERKEVKLTEKAKKLRDITLLLEIIQNHIKWFYLNLMPEVVKLKSELSEKYFPVKGYMWREGLRVSNFATKAISIIAGQWPHNSYIVPGGITSDPLVSDIRNVESLVNQILKFFEKNISGIGINNYINLRGKNLIEEVKGDLGVFFKAAIDIGLDSAGRSYNRFLTGGFVEPCIIQGVKSNRVCKFDVKKVQEIEDYSYFSGNEKGYSWAKSVRYNSLPYETGPLARQLIAKNPRVLSLYKYFKDSVLVRVFARIDEILTFSLLVLQKLKEINLSERSWIEPEEDFNNFSGEGLGIVEAARGTLIHKVIVEKGKIKFYDIITPTVWNLGPRDNNHLGVAEKAIIGLDSEAIAYIVLRSFDVCSVCTSH